MTLLLEAAVSNNITYGDRVRLLGLLGEEDVTYLAGYFAIPLTAATAAMELGRRGLCHADVVLALLRGERTEAAGRVVGRPVARLPIDPRLRPLPYPAPLQGVSRTGDERKVLSVVRDPAAASARMEDARARAGNNWSTGDAAARYREFRVGRTVAQLLSRGLSRRDIRLAVRDRFVVLEE